MKKDLKEITEKVKEILRANDIEMSVGGCGCCGSPFVSFSYKGEVIVENEDYFDFDTSEN